MSTLMAIKVIGLLLAGIVFVVWQLRSVERDLQQTRKRRHSAAAESAGATQPRANRPGDTAPR